MIDTAAILITCGLILFVIYRALQLDVADRLPPSKAPSAQHKKNRNHRAP